MAERDRLEGDERARIALVQALAQSVLGLLDDAGASMSERYVVLDIVRALTSLRRELAEPL